MKQLYIYAYPAQMFTFQLIKNEKILKQENYAYKDIIQATTKYLNEETINSIFVVGDTQFADKIVETLKNAFGYNINIGKVNND